MENFLETINRVEDIPFEFTSENYPLFSRPFVWSGGMRDSVAFGKWSLDFFSSKYGNYSHEIVSNNGERKLTKIKNYIDYLRREESDGKFFYLKDWRFETNFSELRNDYTSPKVFRSWADHFPADIRPSLRWLYIGVKGSGSALHVDIMNTGAWNAVISGKKLWRFYSPDQIPYLGDFSVNSFRPDHGKYPLFKNAAPLSCIQNPGDLVYTPSGWPHQVLNAETGISVTENFVNRMNQAEVLQFMKKNGHEGYFNALRKVLETNPPF